MKKFSLIIEQKKQELQENALVNERNLYLDFSKKYHKEHGVSGPFDKKFKGDKKAQERGKLTRKRKASRISLIRINLTLLKRK
jgi:hypothetical protein